jgi:hypothetical protein
MGRAQLVAMFMSPQTALWASLISSKAREITSTPQSSGQSKRFWRDLWRSAWPFPRH